MCTLKSVSNVNDYILITLQSPYLFKTFLWMHYIDNHYIIYFIITKKIPLDYINIVMKYWIITISLKLSILSIHFIIIHRNHLKIIALLIMITFHLPYDPLILKLHYIANHYKISCIIIINSNELQYYCNEILINYNQSKWLF